jgi:hypothetical protein
VLILVLCSDAVRRQVGEVYFGQTLALVAVALVIVTAAVLLKSMAWWLRTWRSERLRPALLFLTEHGWLVMIAAGIGMTAYLEGRYKWPTLLTSSMNWALMFASGVPWWRWVYPAIERVLLRASHGALRAGVAALAIAVTVLASGGVWAYVYPRVVPTPPEFEVPAPAVRDALLAMLRYRLAAVDCSIARIHIEDDVTRQPDCAPLAEAPRKSRKKSEARSRHEARRERCQRLMADLELASACRRPDIGAYATRLSAEMHDATTARRNR